MTQELKREFSLSLQYFLLVLVAFVAAFFGMLPDAGDGTHINLKEAWRNVDPYVKSVLLIFSALCVARFFVVYLLHSVKKPLC